MWPSNFQPLPEGRICPSLVKRGFTPRWVPGPDPRYSTYLAGVGILIPRRGKLSPIFKFEFPGVPESVASPGDPIGENPIDFPSPWLTKILEENFWSQKFELDHRDSGRTGNSSLKIPIRPYAFAPDFPKPPPGGLARGHDL